MNLLPWIINAPKYVGVVACMLSGDVTLLAQTPFDEGAAIWVEGIVTGGDPSKGEPVGLSCPGENEVIVEKIDVTRNGHRRWQVKIHCSPKVSQLHSRPAMNAPSGYQIHGHSVTQKEFEEWLISGKVPF